MYKRQNQYLGFENYYFVENYYEQFTGGEVAMDEVLFPEIINFYEENKETGKPYFSFNVSYQGHGPYDSEQYWWSPKDTFIDNSDGKLTDSQQCILETYLGSIWNTNQNLAAFFDYFREEEEPVVIVLFGDHNPWMGDDGEIYDALGINMDLSTQEGFLNYYSTRYLIWANDAAKEVLDNDFSGEGPDIGPDVYKRQEYHTEHSQGKSECCAGRSGDRINRIKKVAIGHFFYSVKLGAGSYFP